MSELSTKAYDHYKDLQQRYEYLVVGILAASIAFFWQNGKAEVIAFTPNTLYLFGLLFLFVGLFAAIVRLDRQPALFALNSDLLLILDEKSTLSLSAAQGKMIVSSGFGVMDQSKQISRIEAITRKAAAIEKRMAEVNRLCTQLYHLRNLCMAIGYLIFLGWRIWLPYFTKSL